ncbi:MAG: ribonuclease III [Acidobacteria bacterium]|nr:ribonuclease III [Acidobacteriota bacterium]
MDAEFSELHLLEELLNYQFRNQELLRRAVTHKSYCFERLGQGAAHYEALEFLGDAVLGFVISDLIFARVPLSTEGELSKMKAHLVSADSLVQFADGLQLGRFLRLSHGEEKTGGRSKRALLVDAFEAVIAAIYLDGGMEGARGFIQRQFAPILQNLHPQSFASPDYKSSLQEQLHQLGQAEPVYAVLRELGPDHKKHFIVEVLSAEGVLAQGEGKTKKEAQQKAAAAALEKLRTRREPYLKPKAE